MRAFREGRDWKAAAANNDVTYWTARRAILAADSEPKQQGGVRQARVKMTVEAMCKLEEYLDEDCRHTCEQLADRLKSDLGIVVGRSSVHRALQGMVYSLKKLRIEKVTMNNTTNKSKRKTFVEKLNAHVSRGDMIIYHDETNFNMYLSRTEGYAPIGQRATVSLPSSQGSNIHVQGGVSAGTGIVLLQTHEGSIKKEENARFVADLFIAALATDECRELEPNNKIVIVTDNAPAHSGVEDLAREMLAEDGIMNAAKLVVLRLAPYSPMLNPIEGCWSVLKARIRHFIAVRKDEFLVRGDYDTFVAHRVALLKEAVEDARSAITRRLVWRMERHCMRACFAAERGEDMQLGK